MLAAMVDQRQRSCSLCDPFSSPTLSCCHGIGVRALTSSAPHASRRNPETHSVSKISQRRIHHRAHFIVEIHTRAFTRWRFRIFEPQLLPTSSSFIIIHPSIHSTLHTCIVSAEFAPTSAWYVVLRQILLLKLILRTRLRKCTLIATLSTFPSFLVESEFVIGQRVECSSAEGIFLTFVIRLSTVLTFASSSALHLLRHGMLD